MVGFVRFENDQIEQFMFCPTDNTATSLSVTEIPLLVVTIIRNTGDQIPVGAGFSAPIHTGPGAHLASCMMGTGCLSRGSSGRGGALNTHPHVARRLKK